jgi:dienelactone hydrolase
MFRSSTLVAGIAAAILLVLSSAVRAEIRSQDIEYRDGPTTLRGTLVFDDVGEPTRPAVLVVPEWWGITDYPKHRATQLARMGYVAFVADIYGDARQTDDPKQAGQWATPFSKDRNLMRQRVQAGLDTLMNQQFVDKSRVAAIGYCFGGTCCLELARAGAPLAGVVAFHGDLSRTPDEGPDNIKAKILVCHGADDPMVPLNVVNTFIEEMKLAKADWQVNVYHGAVHAFTNPAADSHHIPGIAYNAEADRRSWMALNDFFAELFRQDEHQ